jgi:serine/threonine-protein kinase RsbW
VYAPVSESELRLRCPAQSQYVAPVRHALAAFLQVLQFKRQRLDDITTAAGEALANIIEHAYASGAPARDAYLELHARVNGEERLAIDVSDAGSFITREPLPGRGFGLKIIEAIAADLRIDTSEGTRVEMIFERKR